MMNDHRVNFTKATATAKLAANETVAIYDHQPIQDLGGIGYGKEIPGERHYCDTRITEIYEGMSKVQKLVIASNVFKEYNK